MRYSFILPLLAAASFSANSAYAEYRTYGNVQLQGKTVDGANASASSALGMVCNVNGPDGFLTIRSGPGSSYSSQRKLNRLAILTIGPASRQGMWVPVRTAQRTHSKDGYSIGENKSLHVTGWAHGNYICDFTAQNPYLSSMQAAVVPVPQPVPVQPIVVAPQAAPVVIVEQADSSNNAQASAENTAEIAKLQEQLDSLTEELNLLREVRKAQVARADAPEVVEAADPSAVRDIAERKIIAIDARIEAISELAEEVEEESKSRYLTPIRPTNASRRVTARKLAELFPKVPFYVDGTTDIGELRIKPYVDAEGYQLFKLDFVDITSRAEDRIEAFDLQLEQLRLLTLALEKGYQWSETAQENQVKDFRKTVDCITRNDCSQTVLGKTSTQLDFRAYSNGSTGLVLIRNKGEYPEAFSFSVESALLLSAYADFILEKSSTQYEAGTRDEGEVDALFK